MPIDDREFARTIALVFRKLILLQATVEALGLALKDRDTDFEGEYQKQWQAHLPEVAPLLEAIDQLEARADAATLLDMLKRFNLPMQ